LNGEVVNVHVKLVARWLPKVLAALVVIVAVKVVFTARELMGVKVATRPAESRETVPATLPLGAVKVNVAGLIVAGFIALLNVAVITARLGQTRVEPSGGVTEVTVGGVKGLPGFPGFLSASPHPTITTADRNAAIQILLTFDLRISFSSSPSYKAFNTASRPRDVRISSSISCVGKEHSPLATPCIYQLLRFAVCAILSTIGVRP
jgi:hypothetical protein